MWTIWTAFSLLATTMATMDMAFYSPELDDDLIVHQMPNAGPIQDPTALIVVNHVLELKKSDGKSLSSMYVQAIRTAAYQEQEGLLPIVKRAGVAPMTVAGSIYSVPVTIGTSTFHLVLDTGSSDPWVASSTFNCLDVETKEAESQDSCNFGPTYNAAASSTYQTIPNMNFNVSYADGENLNGVMAYETISIAGISVTQQEFGLVTQAAWTGDGTSSGLVGFAYSTLTSAYTGNDPTKDVRGKQMSYPTLCTNIFSRGLTPPIFSLALSRDTDSAGVVAIGGIPNVPHSPSFVTTPIQPVGINSTTKQLVYQYYTITIDGYAFSASQGAQFNVAGTPNKLKTSLVGNGTQAVIDSGTTLIYIADTIAASVAAAFDPPAVWDDFRGIYTVDCSATAPLFGVSIRKKIFYVNPVDFFLGLADSDQCMLGIQPNFGGLTILGDVWMKNVLCVFDIGAEQMRFAAREFYDTPACSGTNCIGTT